MLGLIGISQEFDRSGMETLYLDHFLVLIIHSSGKCLVNAY